MTATDDRIVSMHFDNESFERKMSDTMKSLDKLKQSLDFANSTKGMDDLSAATSRFSMGNMASAVEGISGKFVALSTVAITTLATITTHAVTAAGRMLSSFTFSPIMDGFHEFETNMTSIQTILSNTASKGTKLDDVNAALDELNHYSDQTIYNFSEMAKNIGTFTAAGVDLKTSTASIKGIANLAALSGSNSEQASTAMYQLSQAIAAGSVKLMDWNSVVNAGMGGEVFQKALFESGKAMKTLSGVPMNQTFEQWTKAGNTFRGSLESGWLTGEVLTKTLKGFTGDLTEAQIMSMGYTKAQAAEMMKLGKIGKDAATQVKTFTQLIGTIKESVGSGWSETFRTVIGNFEESKTLFTSINTAVGGFVSKSADARNALLKGWKDMGGRRDLIFAFQQAFTDLGRVITPIGKAFRDFFPAMTADRLFLITARFREFFSYLEIGSDTMVRIRTVFDGLFAVVDTGIAIIKGIFTVVKALFGSFGGAGDGILSLAERLGIFLVNMNTFLVVEGRIQGFFDRLAGYVKKPAEFIKDLTGTIKDFFESFKGSDAVEAGANRITSRFDALTGATKKLSDVFDRFSGVADKVRGVLDKVWGYISQWFSELGQKMAEALQPGDFNAAVDVVNVGLLGGIALLLRKFLKNGLDLNIGDGIVDKIKEAMDGLTGTLKAMQTQLKAKALMEIAIAMGVLTASIVVLSLIDSAALTKALIAISVGFGELLAAFTAMDKLSSGAGSAAKMGALAVALGILAGAAVILSIAVKNLSTLSWAELAKGMTGITVMLGVLMATTHMINAEAPGMIGAGIAMTAMAVALNILALAVKSFAQMSWGDMAKGFVAVAVGLGLIVAAMNLMPGGMLSGVGLAAAGVGMIGIATALNILALAVKSFAQMSWGEMAKGFVGVAVGLTLIAAAMQVMPPYMILMAAGLVVVGVALGIIAGAVLAMGSMKIDTLAKGIGGFAAMLLVLAVATNAMTGAVVGAAALVIVAGAMLVLTHVLKEIGQLSIKELAMGLGGIAAVLLVLGVAAAVMQPIIPALFALGAALALIGAGFALFGVGAMLVAKSFEILGKSAKAGTAAIIDAIKLIIAAVPEFISVLIKAIAKQASEIFAAGALIVKMAGVLLIQILDTVIKATPKLVQAFGAIVDGAVILLLTKGPLLIATGLALLINFLNGINNNIEQIAQLAINIVLKLANTLIQNEDKLVNAAVDLLLGFLAAIAAREGDILGAGLNLLLALIKGILDNIIKVVDMAGTIVSRFITELANQYGKITTAGADAIIKFVKGIADNLIKVANAATDIVLKFIGAIADNAIKVANSAADMLTKFLNALAETIRTKSKEIREAGENIASAIIEGATGGLSAKAHNVAEKAVDVFKGAVGGVLGFLKSKSPSKLFFDIGKNMIAGTVIAFDRDVTAKRSVIDHAEAVVKAFQKTLGQTPNGLDWADNLSPVITPVLDLTKVQAGARNLNQLMAGSSINPQVSFDQARLISKTTDFNQNGSDEPVYTGPSEVKFEQNNYSPKALSTNDIYRGTRSQIALAKEVLNVP